MHTPGSGIEDRSRLWLIEGVPGAGKSSLAQRLALVAKARGLEARWWLEEDRDHPVLPARLRKLASAADFPERCVDAFGEFVRRETGVLILDGAAFQSTVRFMFANNRSSERIGDYLTAWASVVQPANPRLLMIRVRDPFAHYADVVCPQRGDAWREKLVAYVERTPIARERGWMGFAGFVQFWAAYQDLCLRCAADLPFPLSIVSAWSETGQFDETATAEFFTSEVRRGAGLNQSDLP